MRLDSDFHDYYYDAVLVHGTDQTLVYNRKSSETEVRGVLMDQLPESLRAWLDEQPRGLSWWQLREDAYAGCEVYPESHGLVLFAGNAYPLVTFQVPDPDRSVGYSDRRKPVTCYTMAEVEACVQEYGSKHDRLRLQPDPAAPVVQKHLRRRRRVAPLLYTHAGLTQALTPSDYPWTQDLHLRYQAPILVLWRCHDPHQTDGRAYKLLIELNPPLSPLQFYRVMDPYRAFQELSMYLSGVLRVTEPDMVQIDDTVRLEGHGFDKATSFRSTGPKAGRKARKAAKRAQARL